MEDGVLISTVAVWLCVTSCLKSDFPRLPTGCKSLQMSVSGLPKPVFHHTFRKDWIGANNKRSIEGKGLGR